MMRHPFDLKIDELAATSGRQCILLSDSESAAVIGGSSRVSYLPDIPYRNNVTSPAVGVTTLAIGEEGGDFPIGDDYGDYLAWENYI